jgi:hypothetical protein
MSKKWYGAAVVLCLAAAGCTEDDTVNPRIVSFSVEPAQGDGNALVDAGTQLRLNWSVTGTQRIAIQSCWGYDGGGGDWCAGGVFAWIGVTDSGLARGTAIIRPYVDTRYRLAAYGRDENAVWSNPVTVTMRAPVDPTSPRVVHFYLNPTEIRAGEEATLHIRVENVARVEVHEDARTGGRVLVTGFDATDGTVDTTYVVNPSSSRAYYLKDVASGVWLTHARVTVQAGLPNVPRILALEVSPTLADEGEEVTLSWQVENATTLTLEPETAGFDPTALTGSVSFNATYPASLTDRTRTAVYTLSANNGDFDISERVALVVNGAPRVTRFTATPASTLPGGAVVLDWNVIRADDVAITAVPPDATLEREFEMTGTFTVHPAAGTVYTLTALGLTATPVTATAAVTMEALPSVDTFTATPATIAVGGSSTLAWTTSNADTVTITAVPADASLPATFAVDGSATVSPAATTVYTITAARAGATPDTDTVTVTVVSPPVIDSFRSNTSVIGTGGTATLTWATTNADAVTITAVPADASLPATFAVDGTAAVTPTADTIYTLRATRAGAPDATATASVEVIAVGALRVNEIMYNPSAVDDSVGEWFEVLNTTTGGIPIEGLVVRDAAGSYTIAVAATMAAGAHFVFGLNANVAVNGGVTVNATYSGIALNNTGSETVTVQAGGIAIDAVTYNNPTAAGYSYSRDETSGLWCTAPAAATYGAGDRGTPGAANPACP